MDEEWQGRQRPMKKKNQLNLYLVCHVYLVDGKWNGNESNENISKQRKISDLLSFYDPLRFVL